MDAVCEGALEMKMRGKKRRIFEMQNYYKVFMQASILISSMGILLFVYCERREDKKKLLLREKKERLFFEMIICIYFNTFNSTIVKL